MSTALDDGLEVDRRQIEQELARNDAGDVQQIVDKPGLGGTLDRGARPLLGRSLLEKLCGHQNRAQRRAQLVREDREEQILGFVRLLGLESRAEALITGGLSGAAGVFTRRSFRSLKAQIMAVHGAP